MQTSSHVRSLVSLVDLLLAAPQDIGYQQSPPLQVLARHLQLTPTSSDFLKVLQWLSAYFEDTERAISSASIEPSVKAAALTLANGIFEPFRYPFSGSEINSWAQSALSSTNRAYFDLLSNVLIRSHAIYLPSKDELSTVLQPIIKMLADLESTGLPHWIIKEFESSLNLLTKVAEKLPFLTHLAALDSQRTALATLFSPLTADLKEVVVKMATVVTAVMGLYIIPHETSEATEHYYQWLEKAQPEAAALIKFKQPLALPAPSKQKLKTANESKVALTNL